MLEIVLRTDVALKCRKLVNRSAFRSRLEYAWMLGMEVFRLKALLWGDMR